MSVPEDAIPDPDDRIETTYKVLLKTPEIEELFIFNEVPNQVKDMESKKFVQVLYMRLKYGIHIQTFLGSIQSTSACSNSSQV